MEKMISPSRPERNDVPPAPGLKVRRSEALEEARRRSRPRDISSGTGTLGPSSGYLGAEKKGSFRKRRVIESKIEMAESVKEQGRTRVEDMREKKSTC